MGRFGECKSQTAAESIKNPFEKFIRWQGERERMGDEEQQFAEFIPIPEWFQFLPFGRVGLPSFSLRRGDAYPAGWHKGFPTVASVPPRAS